MKKNFKAFDVFVLCLLVGFVFFVIVLVSGKTFHQIVFETWQVFVNYPITLLVLSLMFIFLNLDEDTDSSEYVDDETNYVKVVSNEPKHTPLEILKLRLANGEISKSEFLENAILL